MAHLPGQALAQLRSTAPRLAEEEGKALGLEITAQWPGTQGNDAPRHRPVMVTVRARRSKAIWAWDRRVPCQEPAPAGESLPAARGQFLVPELPEDADVARAEILSEVGAYRAPLPGERLSAGIERPLALEQALVLVLEDGGEQAALAAEVVVDERELDAPLLATARVVAAKPRSPPRRRLRDRDLSVIIAHHAGEELIIAATTGGAGAVSIGLLVVRARISRLARVPTMGEAAARLTTEVLPSAIRQRTYGEEH